MICANCKNRNPIGNKFCRECGEKLTLPENSLAAEEAARVFDERQAEKCAALLSEAHTLANAKKFAAAIALAEEARIILPESTSAHSLLATLYERTEQEQKAITAMEKVVALNPQSQADLIKLDQLKRGVHILPRENAVVPEGTRLQKNADLPWLPLTLAGVVAVSVLGEGLYFLTRPPAKVTPRPAAVLRPAATPPFSAANPSGVAPQYTKQVPMYGGPTVPGPPPPAAQVRADPFAPVGGMPRTRTQAARAQNAPARTAPAPPSIPRSIPAPAPVAPVTIAPPPGVGLPSIGAGADSAPVTPIPAGPPQTAPPQTTPDDNGPFPPAAPGFGSGGRIPAAPPSQAPGDNGVINITIKNGKSGGN